MPVAYIYLKYKSMLLLPNILLPTPPSKFYSIATSYINF